MSNSLFEQSAAGAEIASVHFKQITRAKSLPPSWMRDSQQKGTVVSLKPPGVPKDLFEELNQIPPANDDLSMASQEDHIPSDIPESHPEIRPPGLGQSFAEDGDESNDADSLENDLSERGFSQAPEARTSVYPRNDDDSSSGGRRVDTFIDDLKDRSAEQAIEAVARAVEEISDQRLRVFEESELHMAKLVTAIVRRVIAREVSVDPRLIEGMVREGISALGRRDRIVVKVGTYFEILADEMEARISRSGVNVEVIVEASLGEYGCVIESELGDVDESVEARLGQILETLSIFPPSR